MGDHVRHIVEIYSRISLSNWWLMSSKELLQSNRQDKLDAFCALKLERKKGIILACRVYVSKNSPIDLLTGFPAEALCKNGSTWQQSGESNGVFLESTSTRHVQGENIVIETTYDFPYEYTGPAYKKRVIWIDVEFLRIWKVEMTFQNEHTDVGIFTYGTEEKVQIDWTLKSGYLSQMNVNFF